MLLQVTWPEQGTGYYVTLLMMHFHVELLVSENNGRSANQCPNVRRIVRLHVGELTWFALATNSTVTQLSTQA